MPGPCNGSKRYSLPHAVYTRSIVMVTIPIHNETTYTLMDVMTLEIIRDAHDHFGEEVHAIRVQSGLARHALNAEELEPLEASLERLDAGQDDEEEAGVFTLDNPLDNPVEDADEDDEDNVLDSADE